MYLAECKLKIYFNICSLSTCWKEKYISVVCYIFLLFSFDTILSDKNNLMVCQKVLSVYFFHQDYLIFFIFDKRHTVVTLFWILSFILISSIFQKYTFWVDYFSLFLRRKFSLWKVSDFLVRLSSCKLLGDLGFSYIYQKKIENPSLYFLRFMCKRLDSNSSLKA